jgi:CubicO group peptidase (beta-lactamase class C family)
MSCLRCEIGERVVVEIHGFCDERFQPLKAAFSANFEAGLEVGASLALCERGRPVVDLWAGHADVERTRPWSRDTIVLIASSTKIATATSLLLLVERGKVDLDATVATYWPEFAQGGKGRVTVREALSHRAGVPGFDPPVAATALHDWAGVTARIAAEPHWFGGESVLCYHLSTYGFILGEIIRRVDGRRPAQFFREEIAEPAGVDLQIGLRAPDELERVAPVCYLKPPALRTGEGDPLLRRLFMSVVPPADPAAWEQRHYEGPSGNGYANGRALARLAAIMANGGALDGVRYLSKPLVDEATREQVFATDPLFGPLHMAMGLAVDGETFPAPTATSFHWGGAGGSLIGGDQTSGLSFGYTPNNFIVTGEPFEDDRFKRLWGALTQVMRRAAEAAP